MSVLVKALEQHIAQKGIGIEQKAACLIFASHRLGTSTELWTSSAPSCSSDRCISNAMNFHHLC